MRDDRQYSLLRPVVTDVDITTERTSGQRDRDRVLYTAAFRRLGGVTQVVHAREGDVYHNRLTHTLEVAQIGMRMAQYILKYAKSNNIDLSSNQVNPDVVEAACLIHDMGHPPYGHVAENELDKLVKSGKDSDGFEGNAQSFRLATRLIIYDQSHPGLNLSRATLNATLKYPWRRARNEELREHKKFGTYEDDIAAFNFAREGGKPNTKSLEAQIMDVADGIAYAVHDLYDFHRAGILNLSFLTKGIEFEEYFKNILKTSPEFEESKPYIQDIVVSCIPTRQFSGSIKDISVQSESSSSLIARLIKGSIRLTVNDSGDIELSQEPRTEHTIEFLKAIIWNRVIMSPNLASQQYGQRRIISSLFDYYSNELRSKGGHRVLPPQYVTEHLVDQLDRSKFGEQKITRLTTDVISGMSEAQAKNIYLKISGVRAGSISEIG